MPNAPNRPCSKPLCPAFARDGKRFCDAHASEEKSWDHGGKSSTARGYGYRWQQIRARVLAEEPVCSLCPEERKQISTEVDHKKPKGLGGTDARENLQGVCRECHEAKTIRDREAIEASARSRPPPRE